jgi:hypothetical protein
MILNQRGGDKMKRQPKFWTFQNGLIELAASKLVIAVSVPFLSNGSKALLAAHKKEEVKTRCQKNLK